MSLPVEMCIHFWGAHRRSGFFPCRRWNADRHPEQDLSPEYGRASGPFPLSPPDAHFGMFHRLPPGSFPRFLILPIMLGVGSDSNRDGRFASVARFVSPFGGAVNINLELPDQLSELPVNIGICYHRTDKNADVVSLALLNKCRSPHRTGERRLSTDALSGF